jgi:ribosomal protein S12 methylthiotransferase accessory factor
MVVNSEYCLAPWVVKKENVLLGARLKAIKIPHLDTSSIPPNELRYLIQNNYIINQGNENVEINNLSFKLGTKDFSAELNWIWISDESFLKAAFLLKECLSLLNPISAWEVVMDKKIVLESLKDNCLKKPFIIRLSHREPIQEKAIVSLYADLINKTQIVWIGESTDGTHLGPIIQRFNDLEKYLLATRTWYFSKKLIEFGFKDYWPLPIYSHLLSSPERVAEAILQVIKAPLETCFLIEENREVCLWTKLTKEKISEPSFFETQFWSKGLIRNFQINEFDSVNEAYVAKCRSPCKGIDYLEGNSGKGIDSNSAIYSLVGESVERFAAWQSNKVIAKLNKQPEFQKKIIYDLDQFHPFGSKWENYLTAQKIELPLHEVKNEIDPNEIYLVPECLIPFPYEASEPQYDVTTSSTGGLAVYSDYQKAVIKGALELFERDDFYNFFLFQKIGFFLDFSTTLPKLNTSMHNFTLLFNHLKSKQLRYWCIVYNLTSTLPIVHCLILDGKHNFFSRGSGSGYTLSEAASSSLVEALQIRQQFLKNDNNEVSQGYIDWRTPSVIEQILAYLEKFQKLSFFDHPISSIQYTPSLLLNEIKKNISIVQKPLLVANLPCPIVGWFAVRVLIPGFTTHQYPSESLGGKKIINSIFKYAIPT